LEVVDLVDAIQTYPALVGRRCGWIMKATTSLEKYRIILNNIDKKIIIPLDPQEGKPWVEPWEEYLEMGRLYQVLYEEKCIVEPNAFIEIVTRSPHSIGQNYDTTLYECKIDNYEYKAKEF